MVYCLPPNVFSVEMPLLKIIYKTLLMQRIYIDSVIKMLTVMCRIKASADSRSYYHELNGFMDCHDDIIKDTKGVRDRRYFACSRASSFYQRNLMTTSSCNAVSFGYLCYQLGCCLCCHHDYYYHFI